MLNGMKCATCSLPSLGAIGHRGIWDSFIILLYCNSRQKMLVQILGPSLFPGQSCRICTSRITLAPSSLALSCLMQKDLTRPAIPRGVQRKVLLAVSLALGLITASVNQLVPFWDTPILAQVSFLVYLFPIQLRGLEVSFIPRLLFMPPSCPSDLLSVPKPRFLVNMSAYSWTRHLGVFLWKSKSNKMIRYSSCWDPRVSCHPREHHKPAAAACLCPQSHNTSIENKARH